MQIRTNINLKAINSFGIEAEASYFCTLRKLSALRTVMQWHAQHPTLPVLFLGGGSNMLFVDDFPGLVVQVHLRAKEILRQDETYTYVRAGAGENWHQFVRWTIEQNLAGLENLSLIPGTVGAAPVQNIGAYGVELKDCVYEVQAIDWRTGELRDFTLEECQFAYRDSYFKSVEPERWLIIAVTFRLPHKPHWNIDYAGIKETLTLSSQELTARTISDAIIQLRQSKLPDPAVLGNAGSFFKNPLVLNAQWNEIKQEYPHIPAWEQADGKVKLSAAWLIDQCGWKGKREDQVGTFAKHALVLVNYGQANGKQIWQFAQKIIQSVQERFAVTLEPEPKIIQTLN